jgi:hypothetical protein
MEFRMTIRCGYEIEVPDEEISRRKDELKLINESHSFSIKSSQNGLNKQNKAFKFTDEELLHIWNTRNQSSRSFDLWNNTLTNSDKIRLANLRSLRPKEVRK